MKSQTQHQYTTRRRGEKIKSLPQRVPMGLPILRPTTLGARIGFEWSREVGKSWRGRGKAREEGKV